MLKEEYNVTYRCKAPTLRKFHADPSLMRVVLGPVGCLSCDTEFRTRYGWKKIDEWDNDEVLSWNPDTSEFKFEQPSEYVAAPCEDKMLRLYDGESVDMVVTSNHVIPFLDVSNGKRLTAIPVFLLLSMGYGSKNKPIIFLTHEDRGEPKQVDNLSKEEVDAPDGHEYCFGVSTGFFLARRNGFIFITGNSGKSFACCAEILRLAIEMPPCKDNVRRSRACFIRDSAPNLASTTMVTWLKMMPEDTNKNRLADAMTKMTAVKWSPPMEMRVVMPLEDGTKVDLLIYCRHQAAERDAEDLKSLEISFFYANEMNVIPQACIDMALSRIKRFPDKKDMKIHPDSPEALQIDPFTGRNYIPRFCGIADSNMPEEGSWLYNHAYVKTPATWKFFFQPPAMFAETHPVTGKLGYVPNRGQKIAQGILPAENIENLQTGFGYYRDLVPGKTHDWIKVFILGQPGMIVKGRPVFPSYRDEANYRNEDFKFDRTKTLFMGFDWGLHPSVVLLQISDNGQVMVLEEIDGNDLQNQMGIKMLWEEVLQPKLVNEYGYGRGTQIFAVGDPAGSQRNQVDMNSPIRFLQDLNFPIRPSLVKDNDIAARLAAVDYYFHKTVGKGEPGIVISRKCPKLRKGFSGWYYFKRLEQHVNEVYSGEPVKNNGYDHLQDALQYILHAVRNPEAYNIEWRNRQSDPFGDIKSEVSPGTAGAGFDMCGAI